MFDQLNRFTSSQPVADYLKALFDVPVRERPHDPELHASHRRALNALQRFESAPWYPHAFTDAIQEVVPGRLSFDGAKGFTYEPATREPSELWEVVGDLLEKYLEIIPPSDVDVSRLYSTAEAAAYLGLSVPTVKRQIYEGRLNPVKQVGQGYLFSRADLDRFKTLDRPRPGRRWHQNED